MDGSQPSGPHLFVIVTYSQVRKGHTLCRTGAWKATWKPFWAPRVITHLTYCILGGLLYGIHSGMPIRTLSRSGGSQVVPLVR
jgi:hypothetical protein